MDSRLRGNDGRHRSTVRPHTVIIRNFVGTELFFRRPVPVNSIPYGYVP